jgi:hypothetical protein
MHPVDDTYPDESMSQATDNEKEKVILLNEFTHVWKTTL